MKAGLEGAGFDIELTILSQTEKAFQIESEEGQIVWMPKSAFDDDGGLKDWAVRILQEKFDEYDRKYQEALDRL
jgi:hypothetical protein